MNDRMIVKEYKIFFKIPGRKELFKAKTCGVTKKAAIAIFRKQNPEVKIKKIMFLKKHDFPAFDWSGNNLRRQFEMPKC